MKRKKGLFFFLFFIYQNQKIICFKLKKKVKFEQVNTLLHIGNETLLKKYELFFWERGATGLRIKKKEFDCSFKSPSFLILNF